MSNNDVLRFIAQKAKRRLIGKDVVSSAKIKVISNEDEEFKSKVENLLSQKDVVTNPVHYLIDDKVFSVLDGEAKERYLLSTLDKYNSIKNQNEKVSSYSSFFI